MSTIKFMGDEISVKVIVFVICLAIVISLGLFTVQGIGEVIEEDNSEDDNNFLTNDNEDDEGTSFPLTLLLLLINFTIVYKLFM